MTTNMELFWSGLWRYQPWKVLAALRFFLSQCGILGRTFNVAVSADTLGCRAIARSRGDGNPIERVGKTDFFPAQAKCLGAANWLPCGSVRLKPRTTG